MSNSIDNSYEIKVGEKLKHKDEPIIFENVTNTFSFYIFIKQLIIHLFVPFFGWWTNKTNQEFGYVRNKNNFFSIFNHVLQFLFYCMCISALLGFGTSLNQNGALWVPLIFFVLQRIQIAVKYACLSDVEYKKFMNADYATAVIYNKQMMLVSGWLYRPEAVIDFEISSSALRSGVDLSTLHFTIPNPNESEDKLSQYRNWKALLLGQEKINDADDCPSLIPQADGTYKVSVFHVCKGLILHSESRNSILFKSINSKAMLASLLILSVPFVMIPFSQPPINAWTVIFYISMSYILFLYSYIIFQFMIVTLYDVMRQRNLFLACKMMMRISDFHYYYKDSHTFVQDGVNLKASHKTLECYSSQSISISRPKLSLLNGLLRASTIKKTRSTGMSANNGDSLTHTAAAAASSHPSVLLSAATTTATTAVHGKISFHNSVKFATETDSNPSKSRLTSSPSSSVLLSAADTVEAVPAVTAVDTPTCGVTVNNDGMEADDSDNDSDNATSSFDAAGSTMGDSVAGNDRDDCHAKRRRYSAFGHGSKRVRVRRDSGYGHVVGVVLHSDDDEAAVPRIASAYESNIIAWTYTRILLQYFGDRFRFRLDVFVGIILLAGLGLIISSLTIVFTWHDSFWSSAVTVYVVQVLLTVVIVFGFLVELSLQGAMTNDELKLHKGVLTAHILKLAKKQNEDHQPSRAMAVVGTKGVGSVSTSQLSEGSQSQSQSSDTEHEHVQAVNNSDITARKISLQSCLDVINTYNQLKPFTIIGMPASYGITTSIISAAITFFSVLYGALQGNNTRRTY